MAVLAQDTLLGNRYRLSRRIAVGGMGEVWQAEDSVLHRTVAVKVLKSELTSDPRFLERFRAEARTTAALSHPGIANVFDYGEAALDGQGGPETAYLVMEFVDGEPLSAILARSGRLSVAHTLDVLGQAAAALDVAHRAGMVHRDIKPGNMLVRADGVVKLTDFGIARAADAVPLTQSGMVVGTAQYFSPEQAEGRVVTAASDVYSLGVVAYECLTGRLPFVADSAVAVAMMQIREMPPPLPPDIPAPMRALVARALAKDPRARFPTAAELVTAVQAVRQGRYVEPAPFAPPAPAPPPAPPPAGAVGKPWAVPAPVPGPTPGPTPAVSGPAHPIPLPGGNGPSAPLPTGGPATPRGRPRWLLLAAVLLVLALVVAGAVVALLTGSNRSGSGTGPPTASPHPSLAPIVLDKNDYIGGDVNEVADRLRTLRLVPVIRAAASDVAGRPGLVVDLAWQAPLTRGSEIIVIAIPGPGRGKNR
jgi:eukaryotic-like serine/threonine-protein kinase